MEIKNIFQGKKKILIIFVVTAILVGGGVYLFLQKRNPYDPELSRQLSQQAEELINKAQYEECEKLAQQAIDLDRDNVEAYILLARAKYVLGKIEEARDVYLKGLKRNPDNFEMNFYVANIYRDLKEYEISAEYYEKAMKVNPDDVLIWLNYAFLFGHIQEKWDEALQIYEEAINKFPDNQVLQSMYEYAKEKVQE